MITSEEVKDTAFSDKTVELVDSEGKVLAAQDIALDLPKLVEELKDNPATLVAAIEHYIAAREYSSLALILALDYGNGDWHVFEGYCNPKKHTFRVLKSITTFPANRQDPTRPPTIAVNFVASAAKARGLSVWIP